MAPLFEYKGLDSLGKSTRGNVEAESIKAARTKLKKNQIFITDIYEKSGGSSGSSSGGLASRSGKSSSASRSSFSGLFQKGLSIDLLALMTRQLASLIRANIPLVEALAALVEQTENDRLKTILASVRQDVNEGSSLAKAMGKHPKAFNQVFINMIEAGEASGTLPLVLMKLADFQEGQAKLKQQIKSAATYPVLMITVTLGLVIFIFTFLMPKIADIFVSMNKELPIQTRIMMGISEILLNYWYLILGSIIVTVVLFLKYIASPKGRRRWDAFLLRAPIIGPVVRMIAVARFANSMSTLLGGGVPILTAMGIVKNIVGNTLIQEAILKARENITEGQSIAEPLKRSGQFPPLVIHMIMIGERTGELPQMLQNVSLSFEDQVRAKVQGMTSLLEPIMLIGMGAGVAVIVFSVFMPLLQLNNIH